MTDASPGPAPATPTRLETVAFLALVVLPQVVLLLFRPEPLVDEGDGFYATLPFQVIGVREALSGSFAWTDRIGLGYPLGQDVFFQQANPLNLLYLVLEPLTAYHVQVVLWIALAAASARACLGRLFAGFGSLECLVYLGLVLGGVLELAPYQVIFLSSFALVPVVWLLVRRCFERERPLDLALLALALVVLASSQYGFTLVPNLVAVGLIVLFELARAGPRSRKSQITAGLLLLTVAGIGLRHVFDLFELLACSNRARDVVGQGVLARLAPSRVGARLLELARATDPGLPALGWLVIGAALAAGRRLEGKLVAVVLALALAGVLLFDRRRHLQRFALLELFFFALWLSVALGRAARGVAGLLDPPGREGRGARVLFLAGAVALAQHLAGTLDRMRPHAVPLEGRLEVSRRYLRALAPEAIAKDERVAIVVPESFRYQSEALAAFPYQPSQAALFELHEVAYYGNYLLNAAHLERTWETSLSVQKLGAFAGEEFAGAVNYDALVASGTREPLLRVLGARFLISPLKLEAPGIARVRTVPAPEGRFETQSLYRVERALPRAWALPLEPELASSLARASDTEARARVEALIEQGLASGEIDRAHRPLAFELEREKLALTPRAPLAGPALVFVALTAWPAWRADEEGARILHPFGLTALLVPDARGPVTLTYHETTRAWKLAGALLVLGAIVATALRARAAREVRP